MADYSIHNLAPATIFSPGNADELAEALSAASAAGQAVIPWGNGTRQHLGRLPARYDVALVTTGLDRVVEYIPADMVITVEAGATLGAIQAELARHNQWLPWDPPLPNQATIGGLLASSASGPLRLGYGSPRDWTLGLRVALGDGRIVKSGARVVKNVAGYDAHKLHLGALGTLGVIVEATFKLAPLPAHRQTILIAFTEPRALMGAVEQLRSTPLQPIAMVVLNDQAEHNIPALETFLSGQPTHLVIVARYAGSAGGVYRQIHEAARRCTELGARTIELSEEDDKPLWAAIANLGAPAHNETLLLRAGAPPGAQFTLARLMEQIPAGRGWRSERMLLAGIGLKYSRWHINGAPVDCVIEALDELRSGLTVVGGYAVIEEAPTTLSSALDRWGPAPETIEIMQTLRRSWDPAGSLNPGRYLV